MESSNSSSQELRWQFPEKAGFLFEPHRWKVLYGGRDSAKSWSIARALLIQGAEQPLRVGCFREVQKSLKDSVHQLLCDQIDLLGFSGFYEPYQQEIRGQNGTRFLFAGLSAQTRDSMKSYAGLNKAWVEEANTVTAASWDILEPTIREPGSEILVSFNPELDTDEAWRRFVANPSPEVKAVLMNWQDNPWRSKVLDAAREKMQRDDPQKYAWVYGGNCKPAVDGAIYYDEIVKAANRIREVPYDPMLKVHTIWDLGWNDKMFILCVQKAASEIRVIRAIADSHRTYDDYVENELKPLKYNWGKDFLPHDGNAKNPQTGKSPKQWLKALGRNVDQEGIPMEGVELGIDAARQIFPRVWIDKTNAAKLVDSLKRYRRNIPTSTNEATGPVHDDASHGADAFRGLALVENKLRNDLESKPLRYETAPA